MWTVTNSLGLLEHDCWVGPKRHGARRQAVLWGVNRGDIRAQRLTASGSWQAVAPSANMPPIGLPPGPTSSPERLQPPTDGRPRPTAVHLTQ